MYKTGHFLMVEIYNASATPKIKKFGVLISEKLSTEGRFGLNRSSVLAYVCLIAEPNQRDVQ